MRKRKVVLCTAGQMEYAEDPHGSGCPEIVLFVVGSANRTPSASVFFSGELPYFNARRAEFGYEKV